MPIRKSITDPDGAEAKEIKRFLRDGPLPKSPSKRPSAQEREPLIAALRGLPIGVNMSKQTWIDRYSTPYLTMKFVLWGVEFGLYPMGRTEHNETKSCTGAFVKAITRTRRGIQPMLSLKGTFNPSWYRQILDWIEDHYYGG